MPIRTLLRTIFGLAIVVACHAADFASAQTTAPSIKPTPPVMNEKLRDITLNRLDGKAITLSELNKQGPVVVLMLRGWVGYQCPICNQQVGAFISKAADFRAAGANVVLIYPGAADLVQAKAEEFVTGKTLPGDFHFVVDPNLKAVNLFAVRWDAPNETAYPSTFVYGRDGTLKFVKISHSHGDRSSAPEVLEILNKDKPTTAPVQ